jgi:hypothetical protein
MTPVQLEIAALEERLRLAELGPDPAFFEEALADEAVLVSDGEPALAKAKVVAAHQPGTKPKFTHVEMSNLQIVEHSNAAVVTCVGTYSVADSRFTLRFMRVWLRKSGRWQIIAGSISK